ncbi:MAG TPA: MFS transporter [Gaiellaceae bacterium]|jgi:MFS family permease|nr:MFS transporter [Gaiellaceae bacterium]
MRSVPTLPAALHHTDFRRLWVSFICSGLALQMAQVAIGWQVYSIHGSAFDLGLIGLAEFAPVPLLALPAGQLADRLPRVPVVIVWGFCDAAVLGLLLVVTLHGAQQLWQFVALAALTGTLGALGNPAGRSLTPELVPEDLLPGALALRSIGGQASTIGGPALGGLLFAVRPSVVYVAGIVLLIASSVVLFPVKRPAAIAQLAGEPPPRLEALLAGIRFIRETPVILGAITLDLFAVLFGGAVALLPLFAKSILHTGPFGLGVLRSMVAVGALLAGLRLARKPLGGRAGRTLLTVVGVFGACMVVFGLSRWFWLSALALAVSGFVDMFSVNIRQTTVALATPNRLLGRVNAVESVFVGASNELGAFESGAAAALLGAVPAVVAGGVLTIGLALVWPKVFPALARVDRLSAASLREVLPVGGAGPAAAPEPAD